MKLECLDGPQLHSYDPHESKDYSNPTYFGKSDNWAIYPKRSKGGYRLPSIVEFESVTEYDLVTIKPDSLGRIASFWDENKYDRVNPVGIKTTKQIWNLLI